MTASLVDSSGIETLPKPHPNPSNLERIGLVAQRYGTPEMAEIWVDEGTFEYILKSQSAAVSTMSKLYPSNVPPEHAEELAASANLTVIDPQRIRVLEDETGHDMIAINTAWGEKVGNLAGANINKARTSADSTETAKALQIKASLEIIIDSLENLRDVTLEKSMAWRHIPHMDTTHLYDALPTVLGRPLAYFGEVIQSNLNRLGYVYNNCIVGKWADATGNHHSAKSLGMDGIALQEAYCKDLGIGHMMAPAQIPAREYLTAIISEMAINAETMRDFAKFIRQHRSDDTGVFKVPRKNKGSSAMPHKDEKGGNPSLEEQTESYSNVTRGALTTSLSSCTFDYARDLTGSASDRIILPEVFVFGDYVIRRLAGRVYSLQPVEDRCMERVT
ncbi:MAG: lyase family protein, partial [Candidatus Aenigmatarchaeota archaeon]